MKTKISYSHMEHSQAVDEFLSKHAERLLDPFQPHGSNANLDAVLSKEGQIFVWHFSFNYRNNHLQSSGKNENVLQAGLQGLRSLRKQLRRSKDRKIAMRHVPAKMERKEDLAVEI